MLYLRTTINNTLRNIDTFGDESILLDYSFAEIQDITSKNSSFTKGFSLPGSKENNDIFQHYYDVNASMTDYDIRNVFECEILQDGYEIIKGYIRLENVSILNKEITYNVTFYSNVGLLTSNIGDKVLRDLNYDSLDHPYDVDVVVRSIFDPDFSGGTEGYEDGRLTYMLAQYGYEYDDNKDIITGSTPIIDFRSGLEPGYFDFIGTPLRFYYLKPAIQLKFIYDKIFEEAGFKIKSDFFDTAYFKRFYLPLSFNTDSLFLNQALRPEYHFTQDATTGGTFSASTVSWREVGSGFPTSFQRVLQQPVISNNIDAQQFSTSAFVVPQVGNYEIKLTVEAFSTEVVPSPTIDVRSLVFIQLHQIEQGGPDGLTGTTIFGTSLRIPPTQSFLQTFVFNVFLDPSFTYAVDINPNGSAFPAELTFCELQILNGPRNILGDVKLAQELPETEEKQLDFITTVNRRFNLVVVPDVDDDKTFIVEPIVDYLNTGEIYDWSSILDYDSNISILPTTSVINGTLFYNCQDDEDFGNVEFKKSNNIIYGTRFKQLNLDYKSETTEFNGQASHPVDDVLDNVNTPNITIPIYYITREENNEGVVELFYNARKTKPRFVFRGLNLPADNVGIFRNPSGLTSNNSFFIEENVIDIFPQFNRFGTYPFGLSGFTHAVNFNKTHRFNQLEFDFSCYEDLYDVYYSDYIDDLTDPDNRVLIASFYLLPEFIAQLKGNERIFINGSFYRINKISGYDVSKPSLTKVELLKVTGQYQPHRIRYYKLQNCNDPTDLLYSNTDLNFTLWAYVNKRVSLSGECYTIFNDTYDESYDYQKLTIPFQPNSFVPQFFDDCSCLTSTRELQIYRDKNCAVVGPTPSPLPIEQYYYYILNLCAGGAQILARSTVFYTLGQVVRTNNGGSTCYFVFDYALNVNSNDIIDTYDTCELCEEDIPTPSPTRTPTPTPTPSGVGCVCREYLIENFNSFEISISYLECDGTPITAVIAPFSFFVDCACEDSFEFVPNTDVIDQGECIESSPLVTPTPTRTPTGTPTPTPSTCECYTYSITNFDDEGFGSYYANICAEGCEEAPIEYLIGPSQSIEICGCNNTVTSGSISVVVTKGGCCS